MDRYAVIGNPVSHSLSPAIHARFAAETGDSIEYAPLWAPIDDFAGTAEHFFASGARGANVTLPFKLDAFRFAARASERAALAGAANFLAIRTGVIEADNTDGVGLIADLEQNLGIQLDGKRILLVGAGGASRGVLAALLATGPRRLVLANRTLARARELASRFAAIGAIDAVGLEDIPHEAFDLVLNATSTSTRGVALALPAHVFMPGTIAYDLSYGAAARPFLEHARALGAKTSDGLGMLVEQAAESFRLWRGPRPATAGVLAELRSRAA